MGSRRWCLTSYQEELNFDHGSDKLRYLVWQRERCPDTEREHFQCYAEFAKTTRLTGVQKFFNDKSLHCEKARGTRDQARDYCRKVDSRIAGPWEHGDWAAGGQGRRNDLTTIVARLQEDPKRLGELALEFPGSYCGARGGLRDIAAHLVFKRGQPFRHIKTLVLWGDGGVGKTRWAVDHYRDNYRVTQPDGQLWWDGYNGQRTLILDDFYGWIKWGMFLVLLDGYPVRLPVKGGHTWACWERIIITSNDGPDSWYQAHHLGDKQFARRITTVARMHGTFDSSTIDSELGTFDDWLADCDTDEEGALIEDDAPGGGGGEGRTSADS